MLAFYYLLNLKMSFKRDKLGILHRVYILFKIKNYVCSYLNFQILNLKK